MTAGPEFPFQPPERREPRKWIGVHFKCCNMYGRLNENAMRTRYVGNCPRCGSPVSARIGPDGTSRRFFEAI